MLEDQIKEALQSETGEENVENKPRFSVPTSVLVNIIFVFCEVLSNIKLFPYESQFAKRIIRSLLENDGEEITTLMSRQSGKSHTIGVVVSGCAVIIPILANMPMFANDIRLLQFKEAGMKVGIFAPALHQAQIIFGKIKDNLGSEHAMTILSDPEINVTFGVNNGQNIVLHFGNFDQVSIITCMSASENSNIEGKTYMLLIVDEAQDVSNFKYLKSIIPMCAFYNGTRVLVGTPTITRGFFFDAIETNNKEYKSGQRARNHFEYDWQTVVKYNPKYQKHIDMQKRKMGEDSDEFKMSYRLIWILERGMFVDPVKFEKLCANEQMGILDGDYSNTYVAGIDLGKTNDGTVITVVKPDWDNPITITSDDPEVEDYVVYDCLVAGWKEFQGNNWNEQHDAILAYLDKWKLERVFIDATGVGSPIYDRLAPELTSRGVTPFPYVFTVPSKSIMFKHLDSQIKEGRLTYPADEETKNTMEYAKFLEQMTILEKSFLGQHMICKAPNIRNAHDDYPMSLALAVLAAKGEASNKPQTENNNPFLAKAASIFYRTRNRLTARRTR